MILVCVQHRISYILLARVLSLRTPACPVSTGATGLLKINILFLISDFSPLVLLFVENVFPSLKTNRHTIQISMAKVQINVSLFATLLASCHAVIFLREMGIF